MQQSQVAFGTSGARGLVANMTDAVCQAYTQAFLHVIQQHFAFNSVAIGIDLRPSSAHIAAACAQAVRAAGYQVIYSGDLPTPALALYAQSQQIPAIMVTGSHIPFDRNGLKFYRPDGEITKSDESAMLASAISALPAGIDAALPAIDLTARTGYIQRYLDYFPREVLQGCKLGFYEHSSVARDVFSEILQGLGATVISLGRTDHFTPIDTEAVSADDVAKGLAWASDYDVDALISTDGDGDRPLMSDEHGHWLRGDIVGLLCAQHLGIQALAVPVSCNSAIEASGSFRQVTRTRIGSPYVIAGMQEFASQPDHTNTSVSIAGFEANGGFLLGSRVVYTGRALQPLPTRDAVLPVLAVLAAAKAKQVPVSALLLTLPQRYTASGRIQNFATEKSQALIAAWSNDPSAFIDALNRDSSNHGLLNQDLGSPLQVNTLDGLRMTFDHSIVIHLRPSGNAPELRCYTEAGSGEQAQRLAEQALNCLAGFA